MSYLNDNFSQDLVNQQPAIDQALTAFVEAARSASGESPETSSFERSVYRVLVESKKIIRLEHLRSQIGLASVSTYEAEKSTANLELFDKIVFQGKKLVDTWGGRIYFVYLPEWLRYAYPTVDRRNRKRVLEMVRARDIPIIDLHPVFEACGDPLALFPFRRGPHYNEEGYKSVGEEVLQSIESNHKNPG
jgi:hypothetical protein